MAVPFTQAASEPVRSRPLSNRSYTRAEHSAGRPRNAGAKYLPKQTEGYIKARSGEKRAMRQAVLHRDRHRDKNGQISHRHGSVHTGTLRKIYGQGFAADHAPDTTLYELLELHGPYTLSEMHLKMLQQDYEDDLLARKIAKVFGRR